MELTSQLNYPDSLDSSPHSLTTDSWDDPSLSQPFPPSAKIRLMCSYGGHIVPRPHDKTLCYLGGNTRIICFDRSTTALSSLTSTLSSSLLQNRPFSLKYQLPNEDLDSLISIATDEDLDIMIDEYDRFATASGVGHKPSRIRLFLFPSKPDPVSAPSSIDSKSESWFVDALNGADLVGGPHRGMSADVNSLLGLDVGGGDGSGDQKGGKNWPPDVQSVPDSPLVDNTCSPFGSGSSAPSDGGARLPDSKLGLEEQFSRMAIGGGGGIKQDEVFLPHSPTVAISSPTENLGDRVFLEEGSKNLKSSHPQTRIQSQQRQSNLDRPTDAVSRESNPAGVISQQKPLIYQDPVPSIPAQDRVLNNPVSDPKRDFSNSNYQIPIQIPDVGFSSPMQQEQQQQQQFFQATSHYIHHPVTGQPVPVASYFQMHPLQQNPQLQRLDQQYPMYYLPVGQNQGYNLAFQTNLGDPHSTHSNMPAPMGMNPAIAPPAYKEPAPIYPVKSAPSSKPELSGTMYRTAAGTGPQLMHVSDQQQQPQQQQQQQQQYMLYHQLHHPQPLAQAPGANFKYEFADPSHAQMYYNQPMATNVTTQYQAAGLAAVKPETLRQPGAAETKQNRT